MNGNKFYITKRCSICSSEHRIDITYDQYEELKSPDRRVIQEILPDVKPELRELFISGYCRKCFDDILTIGVYE